MSHRVVYRTTSLRSLRIGFLKVVDNGNPALYTMALLYYA